jgi:C_GCAxxG_C_C family probable redox protein
MKNGYNCCQAVIIAVAQVFEITISDEMWASASMFDHVPEGDCTCGALVGMAIISELLQNCAHHPVAPTLKEKLQDDFAEQFGSMTCRDIRRHRNILQRIGKRACIDLTAQTTAMLVKEWEGLVKDAQHFDPDSHVK